jgi:DNA-binding SARP family transcriptional activator
VAVEVRLLGPVEVVIDGAPVALGVAKERMLVALLALAAGRVVAADRLVADVWPDVVDGRGTSQLHVRMSTLRRALRDAGADGVVVTRAPGYLLDLPSGAVDAARFRALVADGRAALDAGDAPGAASTLRDALALWRGAALAGADSCSALEAEASGLEESRLVALELRVDAELACGAHAELSGELERIVADHPLRERLWAQRVLALYRSGRQADALRAYQALRTTLADELGIEPSPPLRDLEAAVLRQDPALDWVPRPARAAAAASVRSGAAAARGRAEGFIGRSRELARLDARIDRLDDHGVQAVFVGGEPGIGKTTLSLAWASTLAARDVLVLYGRCDEEVLSPYGPIADALARHLADLPAGEREGALGPAAGALLAVLPALGRVGAAAPGSGVDEPTMAEVFEAIGAALASIRGGSRLVLVLEDLHWADRPTVQLIRFALARGEPRHTVVIGTFRDTDLDDEHPMTALLADVRGDAACDRISLSGLTAAEVEEMLADREVTPLGDAVRVVDALRSETGGNPLLVGEVLRDVAERGGDLGLDEVRGLVPLGVRELVTRRMGRLSVRARDALIIASVAGSAELPVLEAALAGDAHGSGVGEPGDFVDAIEEALAARLLAEVDGLVPTYEFPHAVVRRAVYDRLSAARRQRLHGRIAAAIEHVYASDPQRHVIALARQYAAAGSAVDPSRAADAIAAGADQLSRGWAKEEAAELYRRALALLTPDDPRHGALRRKWVVALQATFHAAIDFSPEDARGDSLDP